MNIRAVVSDAMQLFSHLSQVESNSSSETNEQATSGLTNKVRFTMTHQGHKYTCEECGGYKFIKIKDTQARCANKDCGIVYNVEFAMLDIDIIYYGASMKVIDIQGTELEEGDVFVISTLWGKTAELRVGVVSHFTHNRMYYEPMRFSHNYASQKRAWIVTKTRRSDNDKTAHQIEGFIVEKGTGIEGAKRFLRK